MYADYLGFHRTISIARHQGGSWPEWFGENNRSAKDGLTPELIAWLCDGADVLLSFETWYGDFVPAVAKRLGVKTALMPMYECCPLQGAGLEDTDLAICVSGLDMEEALRTPGLASADKAVLPVPFDTARMPFRQRSRVETFLHNSGHGGLMGRNSTAEVLDAWKFVKSPAKLIVRVQPGSSAPSGAPLDSRISFVQANPENYWELFDEGDVLLYPHKWDGLSLPIQEALTAGLPVVTTRYWPFCDSDGKQGWLPKSIQDLAIAPRQIDRRTICRPINAYCVSSIDIAARVDELYGTDISSESVQARACAERFAWARLTEDYNDVFSRLAKDERQC